MNEQGHIVSEKEAMDRMQRNGEKFVALSDAETEFLKKYDEADRPAKLAEFRGEEVKYSASTANNGNEGIEYKEFPNSVRKELVAARADELKQRKLRERRKFEKRKKKNHR